MQLHGAAVTKDIHSSTESVGQHTDNSTKVTMRKVAIVPKTVAKKNVYRCLKFQKQLHLLLVKKKEFRTSHEKTAANKALYNRLRAQVEECRQELEAIGVSRERQEGVGWSAW